MNEKKKGRNYVDLYSDYGLDERQKAESYHIAFKVFRMSLYLHLLLSLAMFDTAAERITPRLKLPDLSIPCLF